jgi:hypothetical protein
MFLKFLSAILFIIDLSLVRQLLTMPLIELQIPDDLDKAISSVSVDKMGFILEAVKQKLKEVRLPELRGELIEGYQNNKQENEMLLKEFKNVDLEHWDEY